MRPRLPPLRALQAFESAARYLSFARAAEDLFVTPAAVSQQIKLLEDWAGAPLFRRGARLTLEPHAEEAAALLTEAFDRLGRAAQRLQPQDMARPLVVSAPPAFASRWLVPRLERFHARHPEVELHVSATLRLVDLGREGIDVAIRYGSGRYPGLHVERLRVEEVVAVAVPRLAQTLHHPEDLWSASLLVNQTMGWDPGFPDWPRWLAEMEADPPGPLKLRQFGDAALVIEAALAGLGVALVWRTLVCDELDSGRLVALFPGRPLSSAYHLLCQPDALTRPGIAAFRAWLLEEAA
jgi:LysR family glycine cleavage system transcriptional activator